MSIRWTLRLLGSFFLILALLAIPLDLYLGSRQRSFLLDLEENELKGKLQLSVLLVEDLFGPSSLPATNLQETALQIGRLLGKRVTVLSREGRILGDSHRNPQDPAAQEDLSFRPEILAAKDQGYGRSVRFSKDFGCEALFVVMPIKKEGRFLGYLRLASSLEPLAKQRIVQRRAIYLTTGGIALVAVWLAFLLGRRLRRPLVELTDMVRGLKQGEFRQPFHLVTALETRDLVSALETLTAELSEKTELLETETGELKTLLAVMREGVLVTDEKGRILLINAFLNEVLGGKVSWLKRSVQEAFMSAELQDAVEAVLKGIPFQKICITLGRENPRHFEVQVVALNPLRRQRRAVALFHETTDLLYLLEVRRRFVANASWELDKPLQNLLSRLEALLPLIPPDLKEVVEAIGSVKKELRRLSLLVSEMLDLAQIDLQDPTTAMREKIAVKLLLSEAEKWVEEQTREKGLGFEADLGKIPPECTALWEKGRILQALIHLLDNAVKYTPEGGKIRLSAQIVHRPALQIGKGVESVEGRATGSEPGVDFVEINVADTGPGIPTEHLPRIFERFYRVDRDHSRRLGGTGLGLSIVKHIIEAHGGTVEVKSEPGKGSLFTLLLPLAIDRKPPSGNPDHPPFCRL